MNSLYEDLSNSFFSSKVGRKSSEYYLAIFLGACFFTLSAQGQYEGGSGTIDNPYLIRTAQQMNQIGVNSNDWDKYFKLISDIDMNDIAATSYNMIETFGGVFDGNNCTISNFSLNSTQQSDTGLFGSVSGSIKNLGLLEPNIVAFGSTVGSLVGYLNQGIITNCYARGVSVSGSSFVGGLVGVADGMVANCYSTGNVSGDEYIGGLVGLIVEGAVRSCCSRADVLGNRNVGGLAGLTSDEISEIVNSYATGDVTGGVNVGGLAGMIGQGVAYKSYSVGSVSGTQYVGGLVGRVGLGLISRCLWDIQTSGQSTDAGGTGKTTAEMQTMETFVSSGWDFWNTWTICPGTNYPILQWQIPIGDFLCPDGVDFVDYNFLTSNWGQENCNDVNGYCNGTDLDQSGSVDFADLRIFAEHWLEGFE